MFMIIKNIAFLLLVVVLKSSLLFVSTSFSSALAVSIPGAGVYGEPLILTPYIKNKDIEKGRSLSRVGPLPNAPYVPSYSGFFTVNETYNSNLFFWFFPALNKNVKAPFILWLQGGPGTSGLLGLFLDQGPYILYSNTTAGLREHTWAKQYNILYVDSPVGTGFSFTDDDKGYATNQDQITDSLYEFLQQFFQVYYEYRSNDFYICGETYAAKYVIHLGYKIDAVGPPANLKFKGITMGNGLIDVTTKRKSEEVPYKLGIITKTRASHIADVYNSTVEYQKNGELIEALKAFNSIFCTYKDPLVACPTQTSYFTQISGYEFYYNILFTKQPKDYTYYPDYVNLGLSRKAIHVGNRTYHNQDMVLHHLLYDILANSTTKEKLASLLDKNYKVLLYYGNLDMVLPFVTVFNLLHDLTWKNINEYRMANRSIWKLDGDVAGYVQTFGNFFVADVRNAGHLAVHDQPNITSDMITRFINGISFA